MNEDHILICFITLYKVQCFIGILGTNKTDYLTCEILYDNFTCERYHFKKIFSHSFWIFYISRKDCNLCNKQKNTWVLGDTRFISRAFTYLNTRTKPGISAYLSKQFPTIAEDEYKNNGDNKKNGETRDEKKEKRDDDGGGGTVGAVVGTSLAVVIIVIAVIFGVLYFRKRYCNALIC